MTVQSTHDDSPRLRRRLPSRWRCALVALVALAPAIALATPPAQQALVAHGERQDLVTPLHVTLALDRLAGVGEEITLTCEVTADRDAPGTTARIELPATARLVDGELEWQGDLGPGDTHVFTARIVFDAPGKASIVARTLHRIDARNSWGDMASAYLTVGSRASLQGFPSVPLDQRDSEGEMSEGPTGILLGSQAWRGSGLEQAPPPPAHEAIAPPLAPAAEAPCTVIDEKPGVYLPPPCDAPEAPAPAPQADEDEPEETASRPLADLTVTGRWFYFDQDNQYVPARELLVELIRGDDSAHLAWCYTDLNGAYSCGPVANPGSVGVRTRMHTKTAYNPSPNVLAVVNPDVGTTDAAGNTYRVRTGVVVFADGVQDIGTWHCVSGNACQHAYWTHAALVDTWRYIHFNGGGTEAGSTTVEWKSDSTDGNYYTRGGNVHLRGDAPLSHRGTTAKHEYGHNIMWNVYGGSMPSNPNCNPHNIREISSTGCAWTEGWAEFLPAVVNDDPTYYWASGASLDLEGPTWNSFGWDNGDAVEGRVAGAMWDMFDAQNDGDDTYGTGTGAHFARFWDVMRSGQRDTFSQWWARWLSRGHPNTSWGPIMGIYQNTIDYRSGPPNDDYANRIVIGSNATSYTVTNLNTRNATTQGIDPALPCGSTVNPRQSRSVWYSFTPATTQVFELDTTGSDYDTVLALWTGNSVSFKSRGCNDDGGPGVTSFLRRTLHAGTTYFIEPTAFSAGDGGLLSFKLKQRAGDLIFADGFTGSR